MISKDNAEVGAKALSIAVGELMTAWSEVGLEPAIDRAQAAVTAQLLEAVAGDLKTLAAAIRVLARWAEPTPPSRVGRDMARA